MNDTDPYERRLDRSPDDLVAQRHQGEASLEVTEVDALAVHRDPSQASPSATPDATGGPGRGVAWVRPTELAMQLGSGAAGRGIDLQTALATRARRSPATVARQSRRITRTAIGRPAPAVAITPADRPEEVEL